MHECFNGTYDATRELRIACTIAQMEREGGISPRVSPLAQACVLANIIYLSVMIIYIFNKCNTVYIK